MLQEVAEPFASNEESEVRDHAKICSHVSARPWKASIQRYIRTKAELIPMNATREEIQVRRNMVATLDPSIVLNLPSGVAQPKVKACADSGEDKGGKGSEADSTASGRAAPLVVTVPTPSSVAAAKGAGTNGGRSLDQPDPSKSGSGLIPMDFDHKASHAAHMEAGG